MYILQTIPWQLYNMYILYMICTYSKRYHGNYICTYYIVALDIVRKQTPAICKTKSVYFFFIKTTFMECALYVHSRW